MEQPDTNLHPEQIRVLEALLTAPTHTEAAKAAGISRSSLYRMLQEPDFQRAYRAARVAALKHALGRLQRLSDTAVTELESILIDRKLSAYARLKAIELVLTHAIQGNTLEELLLRVEELEAYHAQTH